jgi:hypothetical protein
MGYQIALMEKQQSPSDENPLEGLQDALHIFLSTVSVERLSKTLRNLFLSHVYNESDTPLVDQEECVLELQALFDLLDVMERVPMQKARDSSSL